MSDAAGGDSGFTLIELLIAFTILAIVSGSLFQMFFISARNNADASDYDAANSLVVTAAETFKKNPGLDGENMFRVRPGELSGTTWRSAGGDRFLKYYDALWNELETTWNIEGAEADVPDGARYSLEARLYDRVGGDGDSGGGDGGGGDGIGKTLGSGGSDERRTAGTVNLKMGSAQDYRLVVNDVSGDIEVIFNGIPQIIANVEAGRPISVNITFDQTGVLPKHITAVNQTAIALNMSITGVPELDAPATNVGGASNADAEADGEDAGGGATNAGLATNAGVGAMGGEDNRRKYVEVTPVSGSINVVYLGSRAQISDSAYRVFETSVSSLSGDGFELARIEAGKYLPN